jgi:hypothetical protein
MILNCSNFTEVSTSSEKCWCSFDMPRDGGVINGRKHDRPDQKLKIIFQLAQNLFLRVDQHQCMKMFLHWLLYGVLKHQENILLWINALYIIKTYC